MRVALLVPSLQLGGAEKNIVVLGEALREGGLEVEIWLTSSDQREISTTLEVVPAINTSRVMMRGYSIVRRVAGIRRNVTRFRPDCMVSFLESSNIPALLAGIGERLPTLVSVRGNPERFNWFYRLMALLLYRFASSVVAPRARSRMFWRGVIGCAIRLAFQIFNRRRQDMRSRSWTR